MWGNDTMCPDKAPIGTPTLSLPASTPPSLDATLPSWWQTTAYRHFGPTCDVTTTRSVVESPDAVARHSFWPFVRYEKRTRRFDYRTGEATVKARAVQYAAHLDANIFSYYTEQLATLYNARLDSLGLSDHVTAYRPLGRSNVHFAAEAFAWIRDHAPCIAHCYDVQGFFDHLDHQRIKAAWCALLGVDRLPPDHFAVFSALTRSAYIDRERLSGVLTQPERGKRYCTAAEFRRLRETGVLHIEQNRTGRGIPQGVPLCALLSNVYMLEFDRRLAAEIETLGGFYRRYCDDILIALPTRHGTSFPLDAFLQQALAEQRLPLNEKKTTCHQVVLDKPGAVPRIVPPVTYLGLTYDGERVMLRGATLARFHRRMQGAVSGARRRASTSEGKRQFPRAQLRKRFTHIGRRNFFSYVRSIPAILQAYGFDEPKAAQRQLRRSRDRLERLIGAGGAEDLSR